ncbi:hypothetical protein GCM10009759_78870 [Kitasatospora saccharophila]|uniref:Uncharacterized protein n=1 Tax=Kitasatospora saccharophila TaxID=407973 RepID=A0ABN2YFJ1_9ACTN
MAQTRTTLGIGAYTLLPPLRKTVGTTEDRIFTSAGSNCCPFKGRNDGNAVRTAGAPRSVITPPRGGPDVRYEPGAQHLTALLPLQGVVTMCFAIGFSAMAHALLPLHGVLGTLCMGVSSDWLCPVIGGDQV